ncbi:AraC family transcriptional regulator [Streptomyces sp. IBSNAI002]|uniref:AraC family transcriptional regulator n=1 Tax=Streptomyces sp. IBSNAI002 TaxID=3457500 RepID=UPI003FD4745C
MGPMIRVSSLRGFAPLVQELGGDVDMLLNRFGIPRQVLESDDGLVSITAHDRMLDAAAQQLACRDLGLRLAERQDLTVLGPLAVAIESSSTVAEALDCASRFMFVHSPALSVAVGPDPRGRRGVVALTYRKDLRESLYSPQAMELGLGLFHRVAALLLGGLSGLSGLRSVELPHAPVSPVRRYLDFFGSDVRFGAPTGALCVERRVLDERFAGADEAIRRIAVEHLSRDYREPGESAATKVRLALAETLGTATPSVANAARLLAAHPRTLQRRLAEEGTSFEAILNDVRREAAHRWITCTNLPFGQVAALAGFTEQSSLTHAVRRWYGVTPRELRRTGGS